MNRIFVSLLFCFLMLGGASTAFATAESNEAEIIAFINDLGSKDYDVRGKAIEGLLDIGADAVPYLVTALEDEDWRIRKGACEALGEFGALAEDSVDDIAGLLADEQSRVRAAAAKALVGLAAYAEDTVPELLVAFDDTESGVRGAAAWALGEIGYKSDEVFKRLEKALGDEAWWVRDRASYGLAGFGADAVPTLLDAIDEGDAVVKWHAVYAIGLIGPDASDAIPTLIDLLGDSDQGVRSIAADSLGMMKDKAVTAVPELIDALGDDNEWVRAASADALARIGKLAVDAVDELIYVLENDDSTAARHNAAVALGQMGLADGVVPALIDALGDKEKDVSDGAKYGLNSLGLNGIAQIDFGNVAPVTMLTNLLGDDDDELVKDVATALGAYGSKASSALSTLKALADAETDDEMRWYFREAIRKITGEE